jgi:hypothetical protein
MALGHSPRIVSDGLIFYVDAVNTRCYAGAGTGFTVTDLSASRLNQSFNQNKYLTGTAWQLEANGSTPYQIPFDLGNNWTYEAEYQIYYNNGFNTLLSYGSYGDGILLRSFRGDGFYVKGTNYGSPNTLGTANTGTSWWVPLKVTCVDNGTNLTVSVFSGTSYMNSIISATQTTGLNPSNKLISIGSALHSSGEGISGAVRNIVITKTGYATSGPSAFIYDGTATSTSTTLFTANLTSKTLSAWCKLGSTSQTGGGVITIENSDGSVFDSIVYNQTGNGWGFGSESFNRSTWSGISETSTSTWVHIAASYESGNNKLYRNGQLILTNTSTTYNFTSNTRIMMGRRNTGGSGAVFNGNIAQGLVYNRALSAAEIYNVFVAHKGRYGY